jgi:multidrug resistance efflux pump
MRIRRWFFRLLILLLVLIGLLYANAWLGWLQLPWLPPLPFIRTPDETVVDALPPDQPLSETVPIQRAADFIPDLKVAGKLEFRTIYEIKAPFEETITAVNVENGALVKAGDVLATLDLEKLGAQLDNAWLELTKARQALADLSVGGGQVELMEANAELLTAQEELEKLEKGPTGPEISAAQVAIDEARLAYERLLQKNDPNAKEVRQTRFDLRQAEITLEKAQQAYNAISWQGDLAASAEAAALQSAVISHENAQRTYEEAIKPPTELEIQKAQNDINRAQSEYNKLFTKATPAQVEQARVRVAKAEQKVAQLQNGSASLKVQEAEATVLDKLTEVESIRTKLLSTSNLQAPVDGQVVKLSVKPGQVVKAGDTVAAVAVPDQVKLSLPVSELFILRIQVGMSVTIALDVLPAQPITGVVSGFTPIEVQTSSDANNTQGPGGGATQFTTYPVTVIVAESSLAGQLRPGMSAQVTFVGSNQLAPNSWLVPMNGIQDQTGAIGTIQVLRGETPTPLQVQVTEQTQGDWVVVVSDQLQEGDMVVGSTATFLDSAPTGPPFGPG